MNARLAADFFGVPLAIHPAKGLLIAKALVPHLDAPLAFDWGAGFSYAPLRDRLDYAVVDSVAVIEATGYFVPRAAGLPVDAGFVGCDEIWRVFSEALNDRAAKAIALVVDSIGGDVAGCLDLSDQIFEARGQKPITAILEESAYGAAYIVASAADEVTVPRTGGAGSVGIAVMHLNASEAMDKAGVGVTLIQYGEHKADGNEYEPLPPEVRDRLQRDVDTIGELFVETVARNRDLPVSVIRKQQAATFLGKDAVDAGLADPVPSPEAAFEEVAAFVSKMRR